MSKPKARHGATLALRVETEDGAASVGKMMTEAARQIATILTSQYAQHPSVYHIDIIFTMEEQ